MILIRLFFLIFILSVNLLAANVSSNIVTYEFTDINTNSQISLSLSGNVLLAIAPGGNVKISSESADLLLIKDSQVFKQGRDFILVAPNSPGEYFFNFLVNNEPLKVAIFVPFPANIIKQGKGYKVFVDGEDMGFYRLPTESGAEKVLAHPESYYPPKWWLKITDLNANLHLTKNLLVSDLVVPQGENKIRHSVWAPICYPLWLSLEELRLALSSHGLGEESLRLISFFRSPSYNRSIGSGYFSRHIYGDACDFYISKSGNIRSDDIIKDGKLNRYDGLWVVAVIEELQSSGKIPLGGIGVYVTPSGDHGVTLHLDLRGHRAKWGTVTTSSGKKQGFLWQSKHFAELDQEEELARQAKAKAKGEKYQPSKLEPLPEIR